MRTMNCGCKIEAGQRPNVSECKVHADRPYPCRRTNCQDYRPKITPFTDRWPSCECGAAAQEHD